MPRTNIKIFLYKITSSIGTIYSRIWAFNDYHRNYNLCAINYFDGAKYKFTINHRRYRYFDEIIRNKKL